MNKNDDAAAAHAYRLMQGEKLIATCHRSETARTRTEPNDDAPLAVPPEGRLTNPKRRRGLPPELDIPIIDDKYDVGPSFLVRTLWDTCLLLGPQREGWFLAFFEGTLAFQSATHDAAWRKEHNRRIAQGRSHRINCEAMLRRALAQGIENGWLVRDDTARSPRYDCGVLPVEHTWPFKYWSPGTRTVEDRVRAAIKAANQYTLLIREPVPESRAAEVVALLNAMPPARVIPGEDEVDGWVAMARAKRTDRQIADDTGWERETIREHLTRRRAAVIASLAKPRKVEETV